MYKTISSCDKHFSLYFRSVPQERESKIFYSQKCFYKESRTKPARFSTHILTFMSWSQPVVPQPAIFCGHTFSKNKHIINLIFQFNIIHFCPSFRICCQLATSVLSVWMQQPSIASQYWNPTGHGIMQQKIKCESQCPGIRTIALHVYGLEFKHTCWTQMDLFCFLSVHLCTPKPNNLFLRDIIVVWFLWQCIQNTMKYWAKNTDCICESYAFLLQINFAILLFLKKKKQNNGINLCSAKSFVETNVFFNAYFANTLKHLLSSFLFTLYFFLLQKGAPSCL